MKGRSHLLLTGAAYAALLVHPIATPLGSFAPPRLLPLSGSPGILELSATSLGVALVGLLPDVDRSGSKAARLGGLPTRFAAWIVQQVLGHRGLLHSLTALLIVWQVGGVGGALIGLPGLGGFLAFGWGAHLLIDAMSAGGVPVLWPLPLRLRLPPGVATGGFFEQVLLLGALGLCAWWAHLDQMLASPV